MGAFDEVPDITIPDPTSPEAEAAFRRKWGWEAHEQVLIKGTVTVADQEYITNHYGKSGRRGDIEVQMGAGRYAILDRMIRNWTFLYGQGSAKQGQRVPVSPENIRRLPANYSNPVLEVIDKLARTMTEEEQDDFLRSANGHIVDASDPTNLPLLRS